MREPLKWSSSSVYVDWQFVPDLKEGRIDFDDGSSQRIRKGVSDYRAPEGARKVSLFFSVQGSDRYAGSATRLRSRPGEEILQDVQPMEKETTSFSSIEEKSKMPSPAVSLPPSPKKEGKQRRTEAVQEPDFSEEEWEKKAQESRKDFLDRIGRRIDRATRE